MNVVPLTRHEDGHEVGEPCNQIDDAEAADRAARVVVLQQRPQRRPRSGEVVLFPESRPGQDDEEEPDFEEESDVDQPSNQSTTLVSGPSRAGRRAR